MQTVDEYLALQPERTRLALEQVRAAIRKAVPKAEESISYKMPTYKQNGSPVIYFAGWKKHYSLYPVSAGMLAELQVDIGSYAVEKGTLRLPLTEPVPVKLITRLARLRAKLLASDAQK